MKHKLPRRIHLNVIWTNSTHIINLCGMDVYSKMLLLDVHALSQWELILHDVIPWTWSVSQNCKR